MPTRPAAVQKLRRAGSADAQHRPVRRRKRRVVLLIIVGLLLIGVLFVWLRGGAILGSRIDEQVRLACAAQGIECRLTEPRVSGLTFQAQSVQLFVKRLGLPLEFTNVTVALQNLSGLVSGRVGAEVSADAYDGRIRAEGTLELSSQSFDGKLFLRRLALARHPLLAAFGIVSGDVDLDAGTIQLRSGQLALLTGSLSLTDLSTRAELSVPPALLGLFLRNQKADPEMLVTVARLLKVPKLDRFGLYGELSAKDTAIEVEKARSESNLGVAKGSFTGSGRGGRYHVDLQLSPDGQKALGPLLSLASQGVVEPDVRELAIEGLGEAGRWRTTFTPKVQPVAVPALPAQVEPQVANQAHDREPAAAAAEEPAENEADMQ